MFKLKKKIKYIIASNEMYYKYTLPNLIPSLIKFIDKNNILIIMNSKENITSYEGIQVICCQHNAFEYSALIELVEMDYCDSEFIFLLNDTVVCGDKFYELSNNFSYDSFVTLIHNQGKTNMGMYKCKHIIDMKYILYNYKNMSKTKKNIFEGNNLDYAINYYRNSSCYKISSNILNINFAVQVNYYKSVDLYKYKIESSVLHG